MYIKNNFSSEKLEKNIFIMRALILIVFFLLYLSFWNIQILNHDYYNNLALGNITDSIEINAPRGIILDKKGVIIAENKINFILLFNRSNSENINSSLSKISEITEKSIDTLKKTIKKYRGLPKTRAIPILKDLHNNTVIYIKSRPVKFKEFDVEIEPDRAYPLKKTASHIIGYVSEVSEKELKSVFYKDYKLGDIIGKSGIEKKYETFLRGKKGKRDVLKNNLGVIEKIINEKSPEIGSRVYLTVDIDLQRFIENLLREKELNGAIGVVDLKTGGILSMVSSPGFNPQYFWNYYNKKDSLSSSLLPLLLSLPDIPIKFESIAKLFMMLAANKKKMFDDYSLHNKFTQGRYSPGSIFKIVMALAGLEENVINKYSQITCTGVTKIYNRPFHCWKQYGHGIVNLTEAITDSCNIYFYNLGKRININKIAKYAGFLGLGRRTGIDIPNEISGLVPTDSFKFKNNRRWFPGDTISIAIGGGMLEVTPAQALSMISTVALRGRKPRLHFLDRIEKNGKIIKEIKPEFENIPIKKENFEIVIEGLYDVVNKNGTGKLAKVDGLEICGKTGTQQIISKENPRYKKLVKLKRFKPHSWFVSFAPKNNPKYASVIFIENGGGAGTIAAPLAAKIYKRLFEK